MLSALLAAAAFVRTRAHGKRVKTTQRLALLIALVAGLSCGKSITLHGPKATPDVSVTMTLRELTFSTAEHQAVLQQGLPIDVPVTLHFLKN